MEELLQTIDSCLDITNTNNECEFLSGLLSCILNEENSDDLDIELMESKDKLFFKEVLINDIAVKCTFNDLYQCSKSSTVNWKVVEELDWFLFYIFNRRYGWPDLEEEKGQLKVALPDSQLRFRRSKKTEELSLKSKLVDLLDSVINWFSRQIVDVTSLLMYGSAVRLASKAPVTRLQLCIRAFDWIKLRLFDGIVDGQTWKALKQLLITGCTDVWSRIRDACISRMGPIIEKLSLTQINELFDEFIQLCESNSSQWQIIDGAIAAVCAILRRFIRIGAVKEAPVNNSKYVSSPRLTYHIKIGTTILEHMPTNITSKVKSLVFSLIFHSQQTIRENSIKAFILYLDKSAEHEIESAFQDVFNRLSHRHDSVVGNLKIPQRTKSTTKFLDAYGAQSLICLCQHLFKKIKDKSSYLENWYHYHRIFDTYLSHPASSVRLVTSTLYKYAVSQAINDPVLVKNILHNLIYNWNPDQKVLLADVHSVLQKIESGSMRRPSIVKVEDTPDPTLPKINKTRQSSWEWREGRLLVYELVSKLLIKNHLWYTFGGADTHATPNTDTDLFNQSISSETRKQLLDTPIINGHHELQSSTDSHISTTNPHSNLSSKNEESSATKPNITMPVIPPSMKVQRPSTDICSNSFDGASQRRSTIAQCIGNDSTVSNLHVRSTRSSSNRRKSLDFPSSVPQFVERIKSQFITKHSKATSTSISPKSTNENASFLIQIKELEEDDNNRQLRERTASLTQNNLNVETDNLLSAKSNSLPSFRSLLSRMMHTTAESLVDPRWEVRRMARQTLPAISELLRWLDPAGLLAGTITTHLTCSPSLMTRVALSVLYDTLLHTIRLRRVYQHGSSWQPLVAYSIVDTLISTIDKNLPFWIKSCQYYLDRSNIIDCITPVSFQIVLCAISHHASIVSSTTLCKSLVDIFIRLDHHIHSNGNIGPIIHHFDLYPSISITSIHSENVGLEFGIQLVDLIHLDLIGWLQCISQSDSLLDDQRECVLAMSDLIPVLVSWLRGVADMRGENTGQYLKEIIKIIQSLSQALMKLVKLDPSTQKSVAASIQKLQAVVTTFINDKSLKLQCWWMSHILELLFNWLQLLNYEVMYESSTNNELFVALIQRIQTVIRGGNRRATLADLTQLTQSPQSDMIRHKLSLATITKVAPLVPKSMSKTTPPVMKKRMSCVNIESVDKEVVKLPRQQTLSSWAPTKHEQSENLKLFSSQTYRGSNSGAGTKVLQVPINYISDDDEDEDDDDNEGGGDEVRRKSEYVTSDTKRSSNSSIDYLTNSSHVLSSSVVRRAQSLSHSNSNHSGISSSLLLEKQVKHINKINNKLNDIIDEKANKIIIGSDVDEDNDEEVDDVAKSPTHSPPLSPHPNCHIEEEEEKDDDDDDDDDKSDWDSSSDSDQSQSPTKTALGQSKSTNLTEVETAKEFLKKLLHLCPELSKTGCSNLTETENTVLQSIQL